MAAHPAAQRIAQECLASPLRLLHRAVCRLYDDALRPLGLTIAQLNLLVAVENMGEHASATRLARRLSMEKSTLSRDLARLEDAGWVARAAAVGRQQAAVALTARGRQRIADAVPRWEAAQEQVRAHLGAGFAAQLPRLAERARDAM